MGAIRRLAAAMAIWCLSSFTHAGLADPIYVSHTGPVELTFVSYEAAYTNVLWLYSPTFTGPIFVNKTTAPNTTFDLGSYAAGTTLVFGIAVLNTGRTFFSGPASTNVDGVAHALIDWLPGDLALVGFEDLMHGGDKDYNDLIFRVANVGSALVREPPAIAIVGLGMLLLALSRIRRERIGRSDC